MAQAIKYQKTTISAEQSVAQLTALIAKYGASSFEQRWDGEGQLVAVRFSLRTSLGGAPGFMSVQLRARTDRIYWLLRQSGDFSEERARAQAYRIAWRHLKDLSEQLLLAVTLGLKDVGAAFMDSVEVLDPETGATVTMADLFAARASLVGDGRGVRLLPSASEHAA